MKNYRTWWREGDYPYAQPHEVHYVLTNLIAENGISLTGGIIHIDDIDCSSEQLWAIREGLSDTPGTR